MRIAPNTGLAGRAWASARPVWLPDIRLVADLHLPAVKAGMRSGMAFPVSVQGEVRGVMVFWSVEPREESRDTLDMFHAISNQIGQFMERDIQSAKVLRLSRMHAVLGGINKAIARAMERQQLFNDICRIAVDDGKFGIVWIGAFDGQSLEVTPVAWAGEDAAALVGSAMSTADPGVPRGHSVLGRALRAKQLVYTNDLITETSPVGTRRLEALRRGYRSLLVMPLMENGHVTGAMSFFVKEADFFTPDEVALLQEMSGNISLALTYLSRKAASARLINRDALTGAATSGLFDELTQLAMAHASRDGHLLAIAVLKLENLNDIYQSLGDNAGDALLKIVAARINDCIRKTDSLGRLTSDTFALALPLKADASTVSHVMDRLAAHVFNQDRVAAMLQSVLDELRRPLTLAGVKIDLACGMGVSFYPADGRHSELLLEHASAAAVRASKPGGNAFEIYSAEQDRHA